MDERQTEERAERAAKDPERKKSVLTRRRSAQYALVTLIILALVVVIELANLIGRDRTYSEAENRMLTQRPDFTWTSFFDGSFMADTEDYVADQFMLRDGWISLNLVENVALGKRESNGVYIGKQHYLFEIPDEPNWTAVDSNLAAIHDFAVTYENLNVVMALVPNAAYVLEDLVPSGAPVRDQVADIAYAEAAVGDALDFVSLTDTMTAHADEYIYYRTDHHWTSLGARYAFDTLRPHLGIDESGAAYQVYPVSDSFSGTLASTSGYHAAADEIDIYVPTGEETPYVVNYVNESEKSASVYVSAALEEKNQYEVFLGGNYARIDISSAAAGGGNLLIFKDSYANCLIPFLLPYYRNIYVIDPRYYYDDVNQLIAENGITDILFLYNADTFMTDNSLADVLETETDTAAFAENAGMDADTAGTEIEADADADTAGTEIEAETDADD